MTSRWWLVAALLAVIALSLLSSRSASAQLVVVDKKLVVTELRPDKYKIGVTSGTVASATRNWVKIEKGTRISYKLKVISHSQLWKILRPGMVMRVHGGRDWDNNITAKEIWL